MWVLVMLDCDIEGNELCSEQFDALYDIASNLCVDMEETEPVLMAFDKQFKFICDLLVPYNHSVFKALASILSEGLDKLISENRPLAKHECIFLNKIPEILSEYAFIPDSKIPDVHLLNHFKNPDWIRPVSHDEEKLLLSCLMDNTKDAVDEEGSSQELCEEIHIDTQGSEPEKISTDSETEIVVEPEINFESEVENKAGDDEVVIEDEDSVLDISDLSTLYAEEPDEVIDDVSEVIDISSFVTSVDDINNVVEDEEEVSVFDFLQNKDESEGYDNSYDLSDEVENNAVVPVISINNEQSELIELVADELKDVIEGADLVKVRSLEFSTELKEHLLSIGELVENISNAIKLIGLEGLGEASLILSGNIYQLAINKVNLTKEQVSLVETWPNFILSYLEDIRQQKVSVDIIQYLKDPSWPGLLPDDITEPLKTALMHPQLKEEEKKQRQSVALDDDMSLVLPDDVNPELLEGLLQDLPVQTGEFSVAIQNLQEQENIEYLEVAQRIAHTLKGAGNVVGVKGIANLTHNLEDILEIQSKANKLPSRDLLNVLVDAADCLETMSEALLGIDEPPDNGLSIYQLVLDWANKLDMQGATDINLIVVPDKKDKVELVSAPLVKYDNDKLAKESAPAKKPLNIENMLRVPAKLADDLLRLAGENLISTSQVQEYIKIIQNRYKTLRIQDQSLQKFSYDLEHIVDVQGITNNNSQGVPDNDGFDPLELDQYHELHSMSRRLVELSADSIELTHILEKDFIELQNLVINQGKLQKENEQLVLRTRMVPTSTIIPRLKRGVKQACRLTGKQVDLEVNDNETFMDSEVLNSLIEPLMHILRNSVSHGIEETEERAKANKTEEGHISLTFIQQGDQIVIQVKDDGKGLKLEEIRSKAISLGLDNEVTENNMQNFIMLPGFSTREEVSHISGRGIGLDVVNSKIRELKGSIDIKSEEGKGCQFSLTLPISSFSVHSLLVRIRENVYAFSNRGVEEILYPGLGELQKVGQETMFKLDDQFYSISTIETMLNIPEDRREDQRDNKRPVILIKDDSGARTAVLVQEVIDSRDVIVKSMGPYIPKIPGIVGATVLGDGGIVPVVDLPELIQSVQLQDNQIRFSNADIENQESTRLPYVLVVDDSLSARKSLAQFVEDLGLQVRTARDGMEAVSLIDVRKPDLILVDMEMPRMNGLELTGHIRASTDTRDMPVIMITSRSTDKHRKAAMDKGVDHYMVKPFAEDELASHINVALKSA